LWGGRAVGGLIGIRLVGWLGTGGCGGHRQGIKAQ
jgi:hypothetical protein